MISQLFRPKNSPKTRSDLWVSPLGRGAGGSYKLCYQAPGGSDSVEQKPAAGAIALKVEQVPAMARGVGPKIHDWYDIYIYTYWK